MPTHQDQIELSTSGHGDMHNLTDPVTEIVRTSDIEAGLVHVHNVGSTGAVGTIEFEPGLQEDLPATTLSPSITVPVGDGAPILGTWQQIFHLECDVKPRDRTVVVTVRGD
ncbi:MAG: YjbQ family protein [Salinibacter sp.]